MPPINNMWSNTISELKYQVYSHVFGIALLCILILSAINIYGLVNDANNSYDNYIKTYNFYKQQGVDVDVLLTIPSKVTVDNQKDVELSTIDNPVRYYYDKVATSIEFMKGTNIITQTLEWLGFIFCPIIFGICAIHMATYDYRFQTLRIKAVRISWSQILLAKYLATFISMLILMLITIIVSYVGGIFAYDYTIQHISIEQFIHANVFIEKSLFLQISLTILIYSVFIVIGFILGILCKNIVVPVIVMFIYNLFMPVLGKYDLKNLISNTAHHIFEFKGRFQLVEPIPLSVSLSTSLLLLIFLILLTLSFWLFKKQSKYTL